MRSILVFLFLLGTLASCKKANKPEPVIKTKPYKVLILGNSITYAPADASIGWTGNRGMAASTANNDYVHLLTVRFKLANDTSTLVAKNIAEFENNFDTYDLDLNLKPYRDAKPDILILRIGENVTRVADSVLFEKKYAALLNYFKADNPKIKILSAGSVWTERDMPNKVMSRYPPYISLISLQKDQTNFAFGLYSNFAIQVHPSDKGMRSICDQIWDALNGML